MNFNEMGFKGTADKLRDQATIFEHRNSIYGSNYLNIGPIFAIMFPAGLTLRTADDFNRFHLYMLEIVKVTRYGAQFENGGHPDSADDGSVYWAMLGEVDGRIAFEAAVKAEVERRKLQAAQQAADEAITAALDPALWAGAPSEPAAQAEATPEAPSPAAGHAAESIPSFLQHRPDNNSLQEALEKQRASEDGSKAGGPLEAPPTSPGRKGPSDAGNRDY